MDDTGRLLELARRAANDVTALAGELLLLGADANRVHRGYAVAALELLSEAEAQGVLAATGDQGARKAINYVIERLSRLEHRARKERDLYAQPD